MALSDMVTELNGYVDHNPDLASYKNRVIGELNAAYGEFCTSAQWLFLHKTWVLNTLAPVVGSSTATVDVTNGAYAVTVTGTVPSSDWEGHVFFAPDGEEYEIARIDTTGIVGGGMVYLMTRYAGTTAAGSSSWAVRFLQYAMPADCQEAVSFFDIQTKLRLDFISRGRDEGFAFNRLAGGTPMMAVDTIQRTDRPPDYAPTLAVTTVGGTLDASSQYAVCYTFTVAGRESSPSPVATITTDGTHKTISVSALEDTRDTGDITGIWKKVYYRNITRNGRWLCVNPSRAAQLQDATTTTSITGETTFRREANEMYPSEPWRQYVRFDPPAGSARRIEVRYKVRVRPLVAGSDIPMVPPEFERLIVFRALRRMCASIGAASLWQVWKAEHDDLYRTCASIHLARASVGNRRQSIRMPSPGVGDLRLTGTYRIVG